MDFRITRHRALVGGLAIVGLGAFALRGSGAQMPASLAPVPVQAVVVGDGARGDAASAAPTYAATIHRDREAVLSFRLGGRVAAAPAEPGQVLPAGALVARLEAVPYAAAVARGAADAARAERAAQRSAALGPQGAVAIAQVADAADVAKAASAGLAAARYDLASTRLTMPFAGLVMSRHAEAGETLAPGQRVAVVADVRAPWVATVAVPAQVAARLGRGSPARLQLAANAAGLSARVLRIAGGSDPQGGTVAVDLTFAPVPGIISGMAASASFAAHAAHAAHAATSGTGGPAGTGGAAVEIPAEALLEAHGSRAFVYVIDAQQRARRRQIAFIGFADRAAQVSGLAAGERVITAGAGFVSEGQQVAVTQP